jgi:regulator of nucleoside diphosphate kinase
MMQTILSGVGSIPEISARPPITILQSEADTLFDLALSPLGKLRLAARFLLQELDRTRLAKAGKLPNDVVSMGSYVLFVDEASQTRHSVQLVYPKQADIALGRVSVLSLIGAGLIGVRRGQFIDWPDRKGRYRRLRILDVVQPGER